MKTFILIIISMVCITSPFAATYFLIQLIKLKKEKNNLSLSLCESQKKTSQIVSVARKMRSRLNVLSKFEPILDAEAEIKRLIKDKEKLIADFKSLKEKKIAVENTIKGYGHQWVVPIQSVLDDLADEVEHLDPDSKLKNSRDETRRLSREGLAAKSGYLEENRAKTAKAFVTDAFNAKVDLILSKSKTDNYGKLEREIKDAYILVNDNGKAFKDTYITKSYLGCRLSELKWACVSRAMKENEREEQRAIREQIREEERAQKEYEKMQKEASKQEDALKSAINKALAQQIASNDLKKEELEKEISLLREQLAEAEINKERAKSMAQQTRAGHVYVISNIGSFGEDIYKIGMTRRLEPMDRVKELGDASVPFDFDVHAIIRSEDAPSLEKNLHQKFSDYQVNKVNARKEFFKVKLSEIRGALDEMNVDAEWTMLARAEQYRESMSYQSRVSADEETESEA